LLRMLKWLLERLYSGPFEPEKPPPEYYSRALI